MLFAQISPVDGATPFANGVTAELRLDLSSITHKAEVSVLK